MNGNTYQQKAMRTNDGGCRGRLFNKLAQAGDCNLGDLLNGCLGLAGEAGETLDIVKKWIFHEKPLDEEHLAKELGDVLWYVAMICHSMNWELDEIMEMNVAKLEARYPEGFNIEAANNRKAGDV